MMQFNTRFNTINKENINEMVVAFYTKILSEKNDVSQVFINRIGPDITSEKWQEHIHTLTNFWAMIGLGDDEYRGSPMAPHFDMGLSREMFVLWLKMFFELIDSLYEPKLAEVFKTRAEDIAGNFMRVLGV